MIIKLDRVGEPYHFEGRNEAGNVVHIDTTPESGGTGEGAGPMQLVAMGLGGCSSIDIVSILSKQRQQIDSMSIEIDAKRATDQVPAVFTDLHLHYTMGGDLDAGKVRRAIELSLEKYCSVSRMLEKTAKITFSFSVNGERHEQA
jgi:putative redox protein